jgi:hypothetical protein
VPPPFSDAPEDADAPPVAAPDPVEPVVPLDPDPLPVVPDELSSLEPQAVSAAARPAAPAAATTVRRAGPADGWGDAVVMWISLPRSFS